MKHLPSLAILAAAAGLLATCSSTDSPGCPQCPAGAVCNPATGTCVAAAPGCPASGCGLNAACNAGGQCACNPGFSDCDRSLGQPTSNGCECQGGCSGTACAPAGCNAAVAGACGNDALFCNGSACVACPPNQFNCDGIGPCESATACAAGSCSPAVAGACGKDRYCAGTTCTACPAGRYNCDGINDCESTVNCSCDGNTKDACGAADRYCGPNGVCAACPPNQYNCDGIQLCESFAPCQGVACDASCQQDDRRKCVKNPAKGNLCEDCLTTQHCQGNPGALGPVCDTTKNRCVCSTLADCVASTEGKKCRVDPNDAAVKQCACQNDADCPTTFPHCINGDSTYVLGRCTPRCTTDQQCQTGLGLGSMAYCEKSTGRCDISAGP